MKNLVFQCRCCGWEPPTLLDYLLVPEHSHNGRRCDGSNRLPEKTDLDERDTIAPGDERYYGPPR